MSKRDPSPTRPELTHYHALAGWQAYQPFFPPEMRCGPDTTPTESWWSWRGQRVHLDRMEAPESPIKVIVLHGAGAYGRVMAPAAVIARRMGWETVCPDLPGYGLSPVPSRAFTFPSWVDCVSELIDAELARDGRPVVLFGVSLGGLVAYHAAARSQKVIGLVATTLADLREPQVRRDFARVPALGSLGAGLLEALSPALDGLPLPMRHLSKMDRISNKPELSKVAATDPLGGGSWVPARFLRTLMGTAPDLEPEAFDLCPVLITHPGEDRMTDIAHTRRFFERLAAPKEWVVLEGASHMPTEQPGLDQMEAAILSFVSRLAAGVA